MNIKEFKKELRELLIKHNICLGVDLNGDTHGLGTDFIVEDLSTNKEIILSEGYAYLYPSDLT